MFDDYRSPWILVAVGLFGGGTAAVIHFADRPGVAAVVCGITVAAMIKLGFRRT